MKPIEFDEQTAILAKDQPQYLPLPAHYVGNGHGDLIFCWQLSWRERVKLLFTGKLWHTVKTFNQHLQPQLLQVDKPDMQVLSS